MLNKQKGNMYGFVTHTWNPIKGKCIHECSYCYMNKMYKRYKWNEKIRLDGKCLKDNLGKGNFIFVGSSTDMFADYIHTHFIQDVLHYCSDFDNKYLFQSKYPQGFLEYLDILPVHTTLATTIETNRDNYIREFSKAPGSLSRAYVMQNINKESHGFPLMITVEPIMDFDLKTMIEYMEQISPDQINIGADSGHNKLPEPSPEKVKELITELKKFTKVHLKDNLKRLL